MLMVNSPVRALSSPDVSADPLPALFVKKPIYPYIRRESRKQDPLVLARAFMLSMGPQPVSWQASTTELERGDILSPRIAPDTMALTVYMGAAPSPFEIPIKAMPRVEMVPQDVPMSMDVREHMRKVTIRKMLGSMALSPM